MLISVMPLEPSMPIIVAKVPNHCSIMDCKCKETSMHVPFPSIAARTADEHGMWARS